MDELISVIVPVYNVEEYLIECIESIKNQTYKNIEILLVDDGSKDTSGKICDDYLKKDDRIIVIHKENGGLSDARNIGIKNSKGKYLIFVDSDDTIDKDMCEVLYENIKKEKSDIAICELYSEKKLENIKKLEIKNLSSKEAIKEMLCQKLFDTSAGGKLFRKELFNEILFPKGKLYEDLGTIYKLFEIAKKITYISVKKYYYRRRPNSITTSKFTDKQMDLFFTLEEIEKFLKRKYPKLLKYLEVRALETNVTSLHIISNQRYSNRKNIKLLQSKVRNTIFKYLFSNKVRMKTKIYGVSFSLNFFITKNIVIFMGRLKNE